MSDGVGMINLSHFAIFDVEGADAEGLMEYLSVAKVGADTAIGKGVYTHFLDHAGGIRSDLTIIRLAEAASEWCAVVIPVTVTTSGCVT